MEGLEAQDTQGKITVRTEHELFPDPLVERLVELTLRMF